MIIYDRASWWQTAGRVYGTVLPHTLGRVGALTLFCLLLCFIDDFVLERHAAGLPALDQLGHTVLGVAISLLIVHRTNSSNSRFWEARSAWGAIINATRNLARQAATHSPPADDLGRLLAAFPVALKERLRLQAPGNLLRPYLAGRLFDEVQSSKNPPARLCKAMSQWIAARLAKGRIDAIVAMEMERQVDTLSDSQGICEKIQRTPLPFIYASFIKQLLLIYLASLPFVLVARMGFAAPLVVAVVSLGMLGIEDAGIEIEDPFVLAPNGLPLESLCETIAGDAAELTRPEE